MQMVTGNRLRDGAVIYFTAAGTWSPAIDDALLVEDDAADALLAKALHGPAPLPVVGAALVEARREDGRVHPVSLRERIRAAGPTTGPMAGQRAMDAAKGS
jgi:Protein of unknown function (DUF2849)